MKCWPHKMAVIAILFFRNVKYKALGNFECLKYTKALIAAFLKYQKLEF